MKFAVTFIWHKLYAKSKKIVDRKRTRINNFAIWWYNINLYRSGYLSYYTSDNDQLSNRINLKCYNKINDWRDLKF